MMRADIGDPDYLPDMPPCTAPDLLQIFNEIGPAIFDSMGASAFTDAHIGWWQFNARVRLNSWECRTLRHLSKQYVQTLSAATKRDCPAPWQPQNHVVNLSEIGQNLEKEIDRLMNL